jgi:type II secretory pathway pseudopilin PulG
MSRDQIFAIVATIAVLTGLALGFRELGPPRRQRAESADIARSRNLETISRAIDNFYRLNQHLPTTLDELERTHPGLRIKDPETSALYAYRAQGDTQYQLCATYAADNRTDPLPPGETAHPAGTYCSSYVVNKRLY